MNMQIDFPSNPVDGQTFLVNSVLYTYSLSKKYWQSGAVNWTANVVTVTETTSVLSPGITGQLTAQFNNGYLISGVTISNQAWVRVYSNLNSIQLDAGRQITQDPDPGSGVVLEVISTGNNYYHVSPAIYVVNQDTPSTNQIYVVVTNRSTTASSTTIALNLIKMGS